MILIWFYLDLYAQYSYSSINTIKINFAIAVKMTQETEYVAPRADDYQNFSHEAVSRENMPLSICKLPCK